MPPINSSMRSRCMRQFIILVSAFFLAAGTQPQTGSSLRSYEEVFYHSSKLRIEAYLYKPDGKGPFPVVIYNHGSRPGNERDERPFAYVGKMLAASGYLVLV